MGQSELEDFSAVDESRPVEEARVVAGNGSGSVSAVVDAESTGFPESQGVLEFVVTQVNYTVEGSGADEYPVVHVFGRTPDNEPEHARVLGVEPYFYVPSHLLGFDPVERYDAVVDARDTDPAGEPFEGIRGNRLVKIITRTPRDVGRLRDEFDETYEADILFPNRFLIDYGIESGIRVEERRLDDGTLQVTPSHFEPAAVDADLRVLTVDIEVDDRRGFPEDGEEPIVCLASHDSYANEYTVWLYNAPAGDVPAPEAMADHELLDADATVRVRAFDTEDAMLDAFLDYVAERTVDIATGWNFEEFDAPYLLDRLEVLGMDPDRLSRVNEVWRSSSGWGGPNVKGLVVFDLLYAYQRTQFSELDSYRLDDVGEQELGIGKERYPGDIGDLWEQDPERLLEYNLRDVELCVAIDEKQAIIDFWNEVRKFVGCKLEDAPTPGDAVDMYVLHKAFGKFALPTKGQQEGEEFAGGAVFDPVTGIKEMVSVLDLASLYPSAMVTMNASPETKVDEDYEGETYVAPNGQRYRKEPDGIMREMVDELLEEREIKKASRNDYDPGSEGYERYDRQQAAVKVIMNCFTPDTEVLTPDGVREITDLEIGDEVYSLDPETMELEVKPVTETHEYPDYRGELVDIQTSKIDFRVTPNHRLFARKTGENGITEEGWRFIEAGEISDHCKYELPHEWSMEHGEPVDTVDLTNYVDEFEVWVRPGISSSAFINALGWHPRRITTTDANEVGYVFDQDAFEANREYIEAVSERSYIHAEPYRGWIPRIYDGDEFLDLLARYITDGSVSPGSAKQIDEHVHSPATGIKSAQDSPAVTDGGKNGPITDGLLLDGMGSEYHRDDRPHRFTDTLLGAFLNRFCASARAEKRLPDLVWDLDGRQKRRFFHALNAGDGNQQENVWRYTTSSEHLRDDLLKLCTHLGFSTSYVRDSGSWRIVATEGTKPILRPYRGTSQSTADNGVYCVTVADNHSLLAGRNGKFQFVGQSLYGVSGWERFRLYDKENAAAVTATGREVIEFTEQAASELDKDVIYGDTDSVMLELGQDTSKENAIEQSLEIEEHINTRYDEFALDVLNADFHRFEIEFEKLYRRFFQAGKKKRYAGHIIWKEGKDVDDIDITGFEYKRSDIAPITKEVQERVLELIVTSEDDVATLKDELAAYLHDVIESFLAGDVDLDEIGIPGGIGKRLDNYDTDTAHVRGAKYANLLLGATFQRGSKPKRYYLQKVHPEFFEQIESDRGLDVGEDPVYREFKRDPDVICVEYADQLPAAFEVDYDEMLKKTLKGPIARVLEPLGLSWDEVKAGQEQVGLGEYM